MDLYRYRKRIAADVIQLAQDDPDLVLEFIEQLRESGELEADDLSYLEGIAHRWKAIAQENLEKGKRL